MKKGVFIVFLLVCVLNVESQEKEIQALEARIEFLETRVLAMGARVSELERANEEMLSEMEDLFGEFLLELERAFNEVALETEPELQPLSKPPTLAPRASKENWRKLKRGMSKRQVIELLGEADRINVYPTWESWDYDDGGDLKFDGSRLESWSEPY